jgi:hypothetical protein
MKPTEDQRPYALNAAIDAECACCGAHVLVPFRSLENRLKTASAFAILAVKDQRTS